jgi:ADP-ribosylglycohydrolase
MLGAIIGNIVGSVYEWNNIKTKDFPLFSERWSFFIDGAVMTIAVAEALLNGGRSDNFINAMKEFGKFYPNSRHGTRAGL